MATESAKDRWLRKLDEIAWEREQAQSETMNEDVRPDQRVTKKKVEVVRSYMHRKRR